MYIFDIILRNAEISIKEEFEDTEYAHLPPFQEHEQDLESTSKNIINSKRRLRSYRVGSIDENRQLRSFDDLKTDPGNLSRYFFSLAYLWEYTHTHTHIYNFLFIALHFYLQIFFNSIASTSSRCSSPRGVTLRMPIITSAQINALLQQSNKWRLIPDTSICGNNTPNPSTYYGAIHLTRLFGVFIHLLKKSFLTKIKVFLSVKLISFFIFLFLFFFYFSNTTRFAAVC